MIVTCQVEHQFLGAYIAKNILNVTDGDVVNAIRYHTTGRENMSQLEKLIFIADLIEPSRQFDGVDAIRSEISKNFNQGFCFGVSELYKFLLLKSEPIYYLTKQCFDYYCK